MAAVASMVVLFAWSYFYAPNPPANNANTEVAANANTAVPAPTAQAPQPAQEPVAPVADTNPARTVTIKSPLYEVTLDAKGGVATSWVILRNKSDKADYPIFADGSN